MGVKASLDSFVTAAPDSRAFVKVFQYWYEYQEKRNFFEYVLQSLLCKLHRWWREPGSRANLTLLARQSICMYLESWKNFKYICFLVIPLTHMIILPSVRSRRERLPFPFAQALSRWIERIEFSNTIFGIVLIRDRGLKLTNLILWPRRKRRQMRDW